MKYTLQQYKGMAERFNKMSFKDKIKGLKQNTNILTLAADGNWWGVKALDEDIQEQLENDNCEFAIKFEWGSSEMYDLIDIIGIDVTGL